MTPQPNILLVAGSEDDAALLNMTEIAAVELQGARPMTGIASRLTGTQWSEWAPAPDRPVAAAFRRLARDAVARDYAEQKGLLEKLYEKTHVDLFVATAMLIQDDKTHDVFTACVWSDGVNALLPRTDIVAFQAAWITKPTLIEWQKVVDAFGDLMTAEGMCPERYRVTQFPSRERLESLGVAM